MVFETKETLESRVAKLERVIQTIGLVQQEVVSVIAEDNPKLQAHVIAAILAQQENRDGFTEWLNQQDNVPDSIKTFMMDINEGIIDMIKEVEEDE